MSVQVEVDLASGASAQVLVPGDTAGFAQVAATLRAHAKLLEEAAASLSRVEVANWRGQASRGFLHAIEPEPGRWRTAADAFASAAGALEGFVASLVPARETARQARQAYQEYLRLVAEASALTATPSALPGPSAPDSGAMSITDRLVIGARAEQMNTIVTRGTALGPAGSVAVQQVYAADTLRRQAIDMLTRARNTVEAAGNITADAIAKATEQAPQARRFNEANIRPAAATAAGHHTLDLFGLIPGAGELADGTNALLYLSEDNTTDAAISAAGMLPILGDGAVSGGRLLRKTIKETHNVAEVGAKASTGFRGPTSGPGWLKSHEIEGSHTLRNHKGRSDRQLQDRLRSQPITPAASTFKSTYDAERFTERVLLANQDHVAEWLAKGSAAGESFALDLGEVVGRGLKRGESMVHDMTAVRVFLVPDARFAEGYRVLTSYPIAPRPKG